MKSGEERSERWEGLELAGVNSVGGWEWVGRQDGNGNEKKEKNPTQ